MKDFVLGEVDECLGWKKSGWGMPEGFGSGENQRGQKWRWPRGARRVVWGDPKPKKDGNWAPVAPKWDGTGGVEAPG